MKVFYFTGTGNSYDAAARLGGETIELSGFSGAKVTDDAVGIVCPVYCADLPKPVWDFLDRVEIDSPYIFAVVTAGGSAGNALCSIQTRLNRKGKKLSFGACVLMPDNVILFPTEEEKRKKELELLPELTEKIKKAVAERKTVAIEAKKTPSFSTRFQWFFLRYGFGIRKKSADPAVCVRCKKCESCPVGNIKVGADGVKFGDKCVDCFRCIQLCPENAIRFGRVRRTEKTRWLNEKLIGTVK